MHTSWFCCVVHQACYLFQDVISAQHFLRSTDFHPYNVYSLVQATPCTDYAEIITTMFRYSLVCEPPLIILCKLCCAPWDCIRMGEGCLRTDDQLISLTSCTAVSFT